LNWLAAVWLLSFLLSVPSIHPFARKILTFAAVISATLGLICELERVLPAEYLVFVTVGIFLAIPPASVLLVVNELRRGSRVAD
jgi:hypothetical protein